MCIFNSLITLFSQLVYITYLFCCFAGRIKSVRNIHVNRYWQSLWAAGGIDCTKSSATVGTPAQIRNYFQSAVKIAAPRQGSRLYQHFSFSFRQITIATSYFCISPTFKIKFWHFRGWNVFEWGKTGQVYIFGIFIQEGGLKFIFKISYFLVIARVLKFLY